MQWWGEGVVTSLPSTLLTHTGVSLFSQWLISRAVCTVPGFPDGSVGKSECRVPKNSKERLESLPQ